MGLAGEPKRALWMSGQTETNEARPRLQHEAAALRQGELEQEAAAGGVAAVARRRARDH